MNPQLGLILDDASHVADARRQAVEVARSAGLGETDRGRVALVASEVVTNVLKHAGHGELLVRRLESGGVELLALDNGPGLQDWALNFQDGQSTVGTAGNGLGALARLSDEFDWYSQPGQGAVFRMVIRDKAPVDNRHLDIGVVCLAMPGENIAGDDWALAEHDGKFVLMVADGLGHGLEAYRASSAATHLLDTWPGERLERVMEDAHGLLRTTRGAAVSIASLDAYTGRGQFVGVGNVAGSIRGMGLRKQLISHNGIVGHNLRRVQVIDTELPAEHLLVLHSDGLATQWTLDDYPGLEIRHPSVIAAVLYKEHCRKSDDVTVVVLRLA